MIRCYIGLRTAPSERRSAQRGQRHPRPKHAPHCPRRLGAAPGRRRCKRPLRDSNGELLALLGAIGRYERNKGHRYERSDRTLTSVSEMDFDSATDYCSPSVRRKKVLSAYSQKLKEYAWKSHSPKRSMRKISCST